MRGLKGRVVSSFDTVVLCPIGCYDNILFRFSTKERFNPGNADKSEPGSEKESTRKVKYGTKIDELLSWQAYKL